MRKQTKKKSRKRRLFVMMEVSVVLTILISTVSILSGNYYIMALELLPMALLYMTFSEFRQKYPANFAEYAVLFGVLFIICLAGPFAFKLFAFNNLGSTFKSLSYLLYALTGVIILFVAFRIYFVRNHIIGKVLLADKKTAVVDLECDLIAGIREGEYAVQNKNAKKGQKVMVSIRRRFFGSPRPEKITGVVK